MNANIRVWSWLIRHKIIGADKGESVKTRCLNSFSTSYVGVPHSVLRFENELRKVKVRA